MALGPDLDVALQMQWVVRLATARKLDILILQRVENHEDRVVEIPLDGPPKGEVTDIVREVMRIIEDSPRLRAGPREKATVGEKEGEMSVIHVRFKQIYYANLRSLRRTVLAELERSRIKLFTSARKQLTDAAEAEMIRERRLFFRYIPCEVILCLGLKEGNALSRILVTTAPGPNGKAALQLGLDLAAASGETLTALHVNPDVGVDAKRVGERRLDRFLKKSLGAKHQAVTRRVVVDNQVRRGVNRVWKEGAHDLVVGGGSQSRLERGAGRKLGKGVTAVFVIAASPIAKRFEGLMEEGIQQFVPQIERDDRIALVDQVQSSAAWNFDFLALMILSTAIAAIGLIQNSAAVVIGAMLLAPLMTPMLGLGLALVQGNPMLARLALRSIGLGLCVSLLGGFLVGLCTVNFEEPTREMLARGGPGLLDILVAFASGLAVAYASSRPGLSAALPGVAIAAAILPPIATAGLALSLGNFHLAIGALVLFGINMFTIVLASTACLWMVGFRSLKKTSRWTLVAGNTLVVSVLILGVYLSLQPKEHELTEEFPVGLVEAIQGSLNEGYSLDSLGVAHDELGLQLNVRVVGDAPASQKLANRVRAVATAHYNKPVRVRLLTKIEVATNPDE
jgi:uncharacterized hydrophobic protein (TIGR00271 family)